MDQVCYRVLVNARHQVLLIAAAVAATATGCQGVNHPPSLAFMANLTVTVGAEVRLAVSASDPDGDKLRFSLEGLPEDARMIAASADHALLWWNPTIKDTEPGGKRYSVVVRVDDDQGGTADAAFYLTVLPVAGAPAIDLPGGVVLNLAREESLTLLVAAKDDDSLEVALTMTDAPEGAKLQKAGAKSAYFNWRPTEAQRANVVHRAAFEAKDESNPAVTHILTIVLLNGEKDAGCDGTPPNISHAAPADDADIPGALPLSARVTDAQSAVAKVTVHYGVSADPEATGLTVDLTKLESDPEQWVGEIPLPTIAPGGELVRYWLTATDNDDPTGAACDLTTRRPKSGTFTAAVYPAGSAGACVDDDAEPDDSASQAPTLGAGEYPGRRLCGAAPDAVLVDLAAGETVVASVSRAPAHGPVALSIYAADGQLIDEDASSAATLQVSAAAPPGGGQRLLEIASPSAQTRLTYTLQLTTELVTCDEDDHEPNDAPAEAAPLAAGTYPGQVLCPGEDDWFSVAVAAGVQVTITAAFDHAYGDLDLELWSAGGGSLLSASTGENSTERVTWVATSPTTVLARVRGHLGASNDYALVVALEDAAAVCEDDLLAPNGSPSVAAVLFQGVYSQLALCPDRTDWYAVDLNGGETLDVLAEPDDAKPVTVSIYTNPDAAPVASEATGTDGLAWASYTLGAAGRLYYSVSTTAAPVTYALLQDVTDPPGACAADRFEPNDVAAAATEVGEGVQTWLRLCPGDRDAFQIATTPFAILTVFTSHSASGWTDVTITGPQGQVLGDALDPGYGADLLLPTEEAAVYTIWLDGDGTSVVPYDLAIFLD